MKRRKTRKASWRTSQAKLKVMRTWTRLCGVRRRRTRKRLTRVMRKGELEDESGEVEGNEDLD